MGLTSNSAVVVGTENFKVRGWLYRADVWASHRGRGEREGAGWRESPSTRRSQS